MLLSAASLAMTFGVLSLAQAEDRKKGGTLVIGSTQALKDVPVLGTVIGGRVLGLPKIDTSKAA
ncbi:hypothetical protein QN397_12125 [Variovorax sp. RTB1]|uniref:hypothetical protein n=2 Tax=unclassified Variovorax TaxID=663243 RepID=UPI002B234654|nr:hypothetical protein [Variovorax sp. RTB1]MEB0112102.1 hypothetical protein [Variovorax sp. RTB1]